MSGGFPKHLDSNAPRPPKRVLSLPAVSEPRARGWARLSSVRIGAVVAIAVAVAFVIWLIVRGNDDNSSATSGTTTSTTPSGQKAIGPTAATPAALRKLSSSSESPIYWVGPRPGTTYELTRTAGGRVYVRYLPAGAKIGNRSASYTIVGTYPTQNAHKVLTDLSKRPDEKSVPTPGGGVAVYSTSAPTNIYVAFPGSNVQIEVFDPSAQKARRLVTTGRVAPVG
jgi:hypothetical protein